MSDADDDVDERPFVSKYTHEPRAFSLHSASMAGYLDRVRYLVEVEDADVNQKDRHQAIPLFYACLGGHKDLVQFLLDKGATLERGKYETERCYYAALNEDIVDLLDKYKANPNKNNAFVEVMNRLLTKGTSSDFTITLPLQSFRAHRFVLSARSEFFRRYFEANRGSRSFDCGKHSFHAEAVKAVLEYLYTSSLNVDFAHYEGLIGVCKLWELHGLLKLIREEYARKETVRLVINDPAEVSLQESFLKAIFHSRERKSSPIDHNSIYYPDICFTLNDPAEPSFVDRWFVHQAMLIEQSDYYKAMLTSNFKEAQRSGKAIHALAINEDVTPQIVDILLHFAYCFRLKANMDEDILLEVIHISNQFMMNELKSSAVRQILSFVHNDNVFDLLKAGEFYKSQRLYQYCLDFIEERFGEFYGGDALQTYMTSNSAAVPHFKVVIEEYMEENSLTM